MLIDKNTNIRHHSLDDYAFYQNTLTEEFLKLNHKKVRWFWVLQTQKLSEEFITDPTIQKYLDWDKVCTYQKLSEQFIERFISLISWREISKNQVLSEIFIRKYQNYINWDLISKYQNLSIDFILEFKKHLYWEEIVKKYPFSHEFCLEHAPDYSISSGHIFYKIKDSGLIHNQDITLHCSFQSLVAKADLIDWNFVSKYRKFPPDVLNSDLGIIYLQR